MTDDFLLLKILTRYIQLIPASAKKSVPRYTFPNIKYKVLYASILTVAEVVQRTMLYC